MHKGWLMAKPGDSYIELVVAREVSLTRSGTNAEQGKRGGEVMLPYNCAGFLT